MPLARFRTDRPRRGSGRAPRDSAPTIPPAGRLRRSVAGVAPVDQRGRVAAEAAETDAVLRGPQRRAGRVPEAPGDAEVSVAALVLAPEAVEDQREQRDGDEQRADPLASPRGAPLGAHVPHGRTATGGGRRTRGSASDADRPASARR